MCACSAEGLVRRKCYTLAVFQLALHDKVSILARV